MPLRLNAPVLTLDAAKMHEVDPRNVESLFGMWTVFSKCSKSIKDGSRLEYMSWRVWARETLCCPPQPEKTIVPALDSSSRISEVPSLSNSVASDDSGSEDESPERTPSNAQYDENSALSKSRGKEPHLTPLRLEKIVTTIQEKGDLGPLSPSIEASLPPMPSQNEDIPPQRLSDATDEEEHNARQLQSSTDSCKSTTTVVTQSTTRQSEHRNSDTSVSSDGLIKSGSVVHGFSPICASFRARCSNGIPSVVSASKLVPKSNKKPGMFQLGASSEDDDSSSFEQKITSLKPVHKRSSLSQSLCQNKGSQEGLQKKVTSFRDVVEQRRIREHAENDEGAIASSDEEDEESAIEDDEEDGDWEDSNSDDERAPVQQPHLFRRVESRPNLVSRPSMLSMQLDESKRSGLAGMVSRSATALRRSRPSSPVGPSMPEQGSPNDNDEDGGLMMHGSKIKARPIVMNTLNGSTGMAHSPRTTRRNMLSTELTESLRKNLLWERQQKSQTANAFLKRSRNAQSMANLQAMGAATGSTSHPPFAPGNKDTSKNNSWNHYFDNPWEYNTKGW